MKEANQIALAFGRRLNQRLQKRLTHVGDADCMSGAACWRVNCAC